MAAARFRIGAALHSRPVAVGRVVPATTTRVRSTAHAEVSCHDFADHMLALETILPSMSCSQLAKTGTSVRGMYQAALLSTGAAAGHSSTSISTPADVAIVLDFFQSQLPNQTWLLTYRTAVEQHMQPCQEQLVAGRHTGRSFASQAAAETAHTSSGSSNCATNTANTSNSSRLGPTCTPEHLAEILATIAAMPIQVVQPLPIGFGTPRWSRPMAAADPAAWEHWLATLASVYTGLLAQQQQQHTADAPRELLQQLADFTICLVCSMRWVNVNVDDDKLQTPEFRNKVLLCLKQQHWQQQHALQHMTEHPAMQQTTPAPHKQSAQDEQHLQQHTGQQKPHQQDSTAGPSIPLVLAGSLLHRITYTCLLLLLPPPRPLLTAFFEATDPSDFSIVQLQSIMRGLLFVGCAPPEPWLQGMVLMVRSKVGELGQKDLLSFVEAFRFFGTQVGRAPWLRDVTALMEEFSCVA